MEPVRVAVLGMGMMGVLHATVYYDLPEANLVGLVEADPSRREKVSERFGVPCYGCLDELLSNVDLDAASVCLPDQLHLDASLRLAEAGAHLLVEKPLATTLEDCDKIIQATSTAGLKLMVGFTLRFDPRYYLVQQAVKQGEVGNIVYMYARRNNILASARRLAGRVSLPFFLQVHDIDAMRWMGGAEVEEVYAIGTKKVLTDWDIDDVVISTLRFTDGSIGCIESNWIMPDSLPSRFDFQLEVVGTKGKADVALAEQGASVYNGDQLAILDPTFRPTLYDDQPIILREELKHFVRSIQRGRDPVVGGADGRAATAVALAIEESLRARKPVAVRY